MLTGAQVCQASAKFTPRKQHKKIRNHFQKKKNLGNWKRETRLVSFSKSFHGKEVHQVQTGEFRSDLQAGEHQVAIANRNACRNETTKRREIDCEFPGADCETVNGSTRFEDGWRCKRKHIWGFSTTNDNKYVTSAASLPTLCGRVVSHLTRIPTCLHSTCRSRHQLLLS